MSVALQAGRRATACAHCIELLSFQSLPSRPNSGFATSWASSSSNNKDTYDGGYAGHNSNNGNKNKWTTRNRSPSSSSGARDSNSQARPTFRSGNHQSSSNQQQQPLGRTPRHHNQRHGNAWASRTSPTAPRKDQRPPLPKLEPHEAQSSSRWQQDSQSSSRGQAGSFQSQGHARIRAGEDGHTHAQQDYVPIRADSDADFGGNNRRGGPLLGHRGNTGKSRSSFNAASASQAGPSSSYKKDDANKTPVKQVNFAQGSALAAFAKQREAEKAAEAAKAGLTAPTSSSQRRAIPPATSSPRPAQRTSPIKSHLKARKTPKKIVEIPSTVSVNNLTQILGIKLKRLQVSMQRMGIEDIRSERLLPAEDASLVANELGYEVVEASADAGFDIYPSPMAEDLSSLSLRPPIVTIMGHVDHGKTSLLDALRSTQVAQGEAGGITQHIGAFNVPLSSLLANEASSAEPSTSSTGSITFLDTPGHAAFTAMRSRGASVTDVVVLVVAADDGVKPQTKEVIDLVKNEDVGLVVAITKCDKPGVDISKVHNELFSHGLEVEAAGGDIPCVEVSAHTGTGLADLVETINVVAEVRDLRAEQSGIPSEARIIESRVDKGKGNVTTLIVTRGTLQVGSLIIAGKAFARVRQLITNEGQAIRSAGPGTPVEATGWKDLPEAGDQVLEASSEEDAKRAIETRKLRIERRKALGDMESINEKRRIMTEANNLKKQMQRDARAAGEKLSKSASLGTGPVLQGAEDGVKELNIIVKSDFSGTEEAVSNALAEIGNGEARVKVVETGVGDITDGDLALAKAIDGLIIGFNVKASRQIQATADSIQVPILMNNVIYRLIDEVKERVIGLLPKLYDQRVLGEATIQQVFEYAVKGSGQVRIAGCRVTNGTIAKKATIRVMRDREVIFSGNMTSLKQRKDEVDEIRKGAECGINLDGFDGFKEGDTLQSYEDVLRTRTL